MSHRYLSSARLLFALILLIVVPASRRTAAAAEPLRFLVLADSRGTKGFDRVFELARKATGDDDVSFILSPGDMDPLPGARGVVDKTFGPSMPWYPVMGNHEATEPQTMRYLHEFYDKQLKGKVNPGPPGTTETTYSFDVGSVHIVAINNYWNGNAEPGNDASPKGEVVPALCEWIKADLAKSDKPWKLVVGHEPAFPQGDRDWGGTRHVGDSLDRHPESRNAFWKMLEEQGVTAYVCGHTHRYSRVRPDGSKVWQIDTAQARGDDTWKYDTFLVITADEKSLKVETFRNPEEKGKFEVTDTLSLPARNSSPARASTNSATRQKSP